MLKLLDMPEIHFFCNLNTFKLHNLIDQQKVAEYWLPVEINFSIKDSVEYPVILKHCPHILKCPVICRPDKKAK